MQFRIDKHGQLHIIAPSADPKIEAEIYVASAAKTEELAMLLLLSVARNFLKEHGVSSDL